MKKVHMSMDMEQHVVELEIRLAEQEKLTEELSMTLHEQWKLIDKMSAQLEVLTRRFLEMEEQAAPEIPVTRPPHW